MADSGMTPFALASFSANRRLAAALYGFIGSARVWDDCVEGAAPRHESSLPTRQFGVTLNFSEVCMRPRAHLDFLDSEVCGLGRPFLVRGVERIAQAQSRADWRDAALVPRAWTLHPELCAELAQAWTRAGLMEHASVAAFARFTLQLLSIGAPAELIERSTAAMHDETRHAKICFALASSYAGRVIGPGALSIADSLSEHSFADIVLTAVREGCIGETIAAVEAREAQEHATDRLVRDLLLTISLDETRHAELAWRFVKWALASADEELVIRVRAEFAEATCQATPRAEDLSPGDEELLGCGVIPERLRPLIRARAIENVVAPCARALLEDVTRAAAKASQHASC